jgi:hypothetical protein
LEETLSVWESFVTWEEADDADKFTILLDETLSV